MIWDPDCKGSCDCPGEEVPAPAAPTREEQEWCDGGTCEHDACLAALQDECAHEWKPRGFNPEHGTIYECDLCGGVTP